MFYLKSFCTSPAYLRAIASKLNIKYSPRYQGCRNTRDIALCRIVQAAKSRLAHTGPPGLKHIAGYRGGN